MEQLFHRNGARPIDGDEIPFERAMDREQVTKDIVLSDYPQVQKGNVLHQATTADTVMIFDKEGRLRTNGRPRTVILSDDQPGTPNNGQ